MGPRATSGGEIATVTCILDMMRRRRCEPFRATPAMWQQSLRWIPYICLAWAIGALVALCLGASLPGRGPLPPNVRYVVYWAVVSLAAIKFAVDVFSDIRGILLRRSPHCLKRFMRTNDAWRIVRFTGRGSARLVFDVSVPTFGSPRRSRLTIRHYCEKREIASVCIVVGRNPKRHSYHVQQGGASRWSILSSVTCVETAADGAPVYVRPRGLGRKQLVVTRTVDNGRAQSSERA
jgi:hypothetical protein